MKTSPRIWVLLDDRAGNSTQARGVADKLGFTYETKQIHYTKLVKLPNLLRGASLLGADPAQSDTLEAPWPDIVIAAGRRLAPVARYIKKQNPATKLVQIMWPGFPAHGFDLIAVPEHDSVADRINTIRFLLSPHPLTKEKLHYEAAQWESPMPRPWVTVLVGGPTKHYRFGALQAGGLITGARALAGKGTLLITTSRRTGSDIETLLEKSDSGSHYLYAWGQGGPNPYTAFLGSADAVVVTGDSISMASEACFTGKPVYIEDSGGVGAKHARFHSVLYRNGLARPLGSTSLPNIARNEALPLDSALAIATRIKEIIATSN